MGAIPWGFSYAKRFRIHFSTNLFDREEVKRCRRNRCVRALIPAAPTSVKDSFVQHRVEERRRYDKYERSSDVNRKYGRAWKRIRDRYAAEHPLCEMCLKEGRLTPVQEVHHILPVSKGGTHARDNLMSLCQSCHTKIHHDLGDR